MNVRDINDILQVQKAGTILTMLDDGDRGAMFLKGHDGRWLPYGSRVANRGKTWASLGIAKALDTYNAIWSVS